MLIRKATGYISYVRGENPYTFPFRVYPDRFAKANTFNNADEYPKFQINGRKIPNDKKPKSDGTRKVSPDTLAVYDLDKADWRSFRYDTIKEFDFDLPEDCEYPPTPTPVLFGEDNEGAEITLVDTQTSEDPNVIDVQAKTLH
jgi:hypothetical protein